MKTEKKITEKEFDTVGTFRVIKEKMSLKMANMSFDEIKAYLKARSQELQTK